MHNKVPRRNAFDSLWCWTRVMYCKYACLKFVTETITESLAYIYSNRCVIVFVRSLFNKVKDDVNELLKSKTIVHNGFNLRSALPTMDDDLN